MTRPPREYGIYFDESAKDGVYVFTATVIEQSRKRALERRLTRIRQEMTREMLRALPSLAEHPKLQGGQLAELHAVDLFQSSGLFRLVKRAQPDFYLRQREWLRQTLEAASGYGVRYFSHATTTGNIEQHFSELSRPSAQFQDFKYKSVGAKIDTYFSNPYFTGLMVTMMQVNYYLEQVGGIGNMYCHTYDDAKSYSTIASYEAVRTYGHFARVRQPVFRTASQEQVIQCADAAGYLLLEAYCERYNNRPMRRSLQEWGQRYVVPHHSEAGPDPATLSDEAYDAMGLVLFDLLASRPGGPDGFQRVSRGLFREWVAQTGGIREPNMRDFFDAALEIYLAQVAEEAEAQANRPPTEAEDLYGSNLPESGIGDNPPDEEGV